MLPAALMPGVRRGALEILNLDTLILSYAAVAIAFLGTEKATTSKQLQLCSLVVFIQGRM